VLWDPDTGPVQLDSVRKAATTLNVQLEVVEAHRASDFDAAFLMANQRGVGAMVMPSSPLIGPNVQILAELALSHRLPAITLFPDFARAGGLLAYGPNLLSMYRLVGVLAGKVARGADPAALPIERPTKFETVLNMRTAHALGIARFGIEWDWSPVGLSLLAQQLIFPPLAVAAIVLARLDKRLWLGAIFVALPSANLLLGVIIFTIAIMIYGF
jgi:hypothetical protein